MKLLEPNNYYKLANPLAKIQINHLFAQAVIEQKMDGQVYVNNTDNPTTYLIKHNYGMSLLFGDSNNEMFNSELHDYLLNKNKNRTAFEYLQVYPDAWNRTIRELLGKDIIKNNSESDNSKVNELGRINFQFIRDKFKPIQSKNYGSGQLIPTDEELFNKIQGKVVPRYFWRNAKEFNANAVGFTYLVADLPVSTAYSAFLHPPYLEIGIETLPEYQGRGLAQLVCSKLIEYCIQNGLEPVWACRADNFGSIQLAQKLGFKILRTLPYYQLPF